MEKNALATRYNFEFYDGSTCEMTLAFILLKRLSSKNKSLYERCQKVMAHGAKDELDTLTVLYTAYICANMDDESPMSEDEFIEKCGCDRQAIMRALQELTTAKKQKASAVRSN
jgi:hypothetical protein